MRRVILLLCLTLTASVCAFSAAPVDFSGTWIRDAGKSDAMAANIGGGIKTVTADLIVKHEGNTLQVETRWDYKAPTVMTYILDGNENHSSIEGGNGITYRSSWDQDELIIEETVNANTPFGRAEVKHRYEWSLSEGSNTLTVTTVRGGPFSGNSSQKQVYHR
jgi:hypothetical protein